MKKAVLVILTIVVIGGIAAYNQYGYLLQSARNWPDPSTMQDVSPQLNIAPTPESDQELSHLSLPPGFAITYFAQDVSGARSLTRGDTGVIYVGSRNPGAVYALVDTNSDGRADERYIVASGLREPNGVAYHQGDLYVAEIGRVIVFRNIDKTYSSKPEYQTISTDLPKESHHGWRYLRVGPDAKLYIGIGAPCNVCDRDDPYASIMRMNTDGTEREIVARGIRNTVGFDWDPTTNSLWFTDNGRDQMGDDMPPDELNIMKGVGEHYGFPFCHGNGVGDPQFGKGKNCDDYAKPALTLGPHVAALGFRFYRGDMFPNQYKGKVIIAEHGSWNRSTPIGYRLMTVDVKGTIANNYEEFVTGWLDAKGDALGRPVDVFELPDGSILVSDDFKGAVYRITFEP